MKIFHLVDDGQTTQPPRAALYGKRVPPIPEEREVETRRSPLSGRGGDEGINKVTAAEMRVIEGVSVTIRRDEWDKADWRGIYGASSLRCRQGRDWSVDDSLSLRDVI
ncbi:hypothetical protein SODG_003376 [Sodalis praecaptivus]